MQADELEMVKWEIYLQLAEVFSESWGSEAYALEVADTSSV